MRVTSIWLRAGSAIPALNWPKASAATTAAAYRWDVGWHELWLRDPRAMAIVRNLDIFFPNESEGAAMTGCTRPMPS